MRFLSGALAAVLLCLAPLTSQAQDATPAEAPRPPPRDEIRMRAGVGLGAAVLSSQATYGAWQMLVTRSCSSGSCNDMTSGGWTSMGEESRSVLGVVGSASIHFGVQWDYLAGYVLTRLGLGYGAMPHMTTALLVEVTLGDFFQLGIGPSIDVFNRFNLTSGYERGSEVMTSPTRFTRTDRYVGPGEPQSRCCSTSFEWVVSPGIDVRLGLATGGGPYERRGFVFAPYLHISLPENGMLLLAGLELGWQSF